VHKISGPFKGVLGGLECHIALCTRESAFYCSACNIACNSNCVTGRQSHIGYTSQEKRIIPSNCTNGYIYEDLKLEKEEEGKGGGEVSYIYILRYQVT
jgi:hypothetical protein